MEPPHPTPPQSIAAIDIATPRNTAAPGRAPFRPLLLLLLLPPPPPPPPPGAHLVRPFSVRLSWCFIAGLVLYFAGIALSAASPLGG